MSLIQHAERELSLLDNDRNFDDCILEAVYAFSKYGHSGGSVSYGINVLNRLLKFENLSELTNSNAEWIKVDAGYWQNRRNPEAFSIDGGEHYFLLSEGGSQQNPTPLHETNDAYSMDLKRKENPVIEAPGE